MTAATFALLLLALGLIAFGFAIRPQETGERAQNAARALEDAITRASDLVASARSLGRELEETGMAVAQQAGQHLRALKSAVSDADKQLEALKTVKPRMPKSAPLMAARAEPAPSAGARLDVTVEDDGIRAVAPAGPGSDRHTAIYGLADGGRTVEEIAQALDMGKGEVQLILGLRRPA